jgi:FkbM family methyltransferase
VSSILSNAKVLLRLALDSLIGSIRNDPVKYSPLIYYCNDNNNMSMSTTSTPNSSYMYAGQYQQHYIPSQDYFMEHYTTMLVEEAEKIYTKLVKDLANRVGPHGKVIAIEAHPDNFEILNRNIKLNGLTNVIPLNYAVHSKKMKVKLYSNYTMMSERIREEKDKEEFVEVNANALDHILSQQQNGISHADINWIKIDVEGAELEVLKGAHNVLSYSKDIVLFIEIHGKDNYKPVIELLNSYNIRVIFQKNYDAGDLHIIARR